MGASSSVVALPTDGISLAAILEFIELSGGRSAFLGLKSKEAISRIREAAWAKTKKGKLSYCAGMKQIERRRKHVGPATIFVSHSWSCDFITLVDILSQGHDPEIVTESDDSSAGNQIVGNADFLWLDLFCLPLANGETEGPFKHDALVQQVRVLIQSKVPRTILCLQSWTQQVLVTAPLTFPPHLHFVFSNILFAPWYQQP
jgi:hypothetical protein